jgi:hypothetical protein
MNAGDESEIQSKRWVEFLERLEGPGGASHTSPEWWKNYIFQRVTDRRHRLRPLMPRPYRSRILLKESISRKRHEL